VRADAVEMGCGRRARCRAPPPWVPRMARCTCECRASTSSTQRPATALEALEAGERAEGWDVMGDGGGRDEG
jgi:hypothetical protein